MYALHAWCSIKYFQSQISLLGYIDKITMLAGTYFSCSPQIWVKRWRKYMFDLFRRKSSYKLAKSKLCSRTYYSVQGCIYKHLVYIHFIFLSTDYIWCNRAYIWWHLGVCTQNIWIKRSYSFLLIDSIKTKIIRTDLGMKAAHSAYSIWASADEHGDAQLDDVKLPLLLLHAASQLLQLGSTFLPLSHVADAGRSWYERVGKIWSDLCAMLHRACTTSKWATDKCGRLVRSKDGSRRWWNIYITSWV